MVFASGQDNTCHTGMQTAFTAGKHKLCSEEKKRGKHQKCKGLILTGLEPAITSYPNLRPGTHHKRFAGFKKLVYFFSAAHRSRLVLFHFLSIARNRLCIGY